MLWVRRFGIRTTMYYNLYYLLFLGLVHLLRASQVERQSPSLQVQEAFLYPFMDHFNYGFSYS